MSRRPRRLGRASSPPPKTLAPRRAAAGPPRFVVLVNGPRALARLLRQPNQVGLGRAWVSGDLDLDGDLDELFSLDGRLRAATAARSPTTTTSPTTSTAPSSAPAWSTPAAYFEDPGESLEAAEERKLDLVCRKLALGAGERFLDVGCDWGSLVIHAAARYGVRAVGVTISAAQAELARARVREAGLADRCEIRLANYRELGDGPYDKIASIGMYEHVGAAQLDRYAAGLTALLRPGGLLLNHTASPGSAHAFERGEITVFQALAAKPGAPHGLPLARARLAPAEEPAPARPAS